MVFFCVSMCFMLFDFFSFRWMIMLIIISSVDSKKGMC